jgi:hypothetical protein
LAAFSASLSVLLLKNQQAHFKLSLMVWILDFICLGQEVGYGGELSVLVFGK